MVGPGKSRCGCLEHTTYLLLDDVQMEVAMFSESSLLLRNRALCRRWADESGEPITAAEKLLAVMVSVAIAGVSAFAVAMPFALPHLR
jgi:hypothetical protein